MLSGTDISAWNDGIAPKGDFCIIKLSEGEDIVNGMAAAQVYSARSQNQLVGFYHFARYDQNAIVNADHFLKELEKYWINGDIIVLDHEAQSPYYVPGPAFAAVWGKSFLTHTQSIRKVIPWVYSNQSWAMDGHCKGMDDYPWWGAAPSIAKGQLTAKGPFKAIVAHQYAEIGGIDRDVFYGTRQDWLNLARPMGTEEIEPEMLVNVTPEWFVQGKRFGFPFMTGAFKQVAFYLDNSYTDANHDLLPPVKLRIALLRDDGTHQVEFRTVGKIKTTDKDEVVYVPFTKPKNTRAISITREDNSTTPIGFMID